jgi:hypothetical protein
MKRSITSPLIPGIVMLLCVQPDPAMTQEKQVQRRDIPPAIIDAFRTTYPDAVIKGFSKEFEGGRTFFEVESMNRKKSLDVLYTHDGSVAEIEEGIDAGELPAAVKKTAMTEAGADKIARTEKKTAGSTITYEIGILRGKHIREIVIDEQGNLLLPNHKRM